MTWNYRIIEFAEHRALHEVYYDDSGRPDGYTENAISFVCNPDEGDGIAEALKMALRDVERFPVLLATVFDLPIEARPKCPRKQVA